jgi:hypothetical protein
MFGARKKTNKLLLPHTQELPVTLLHKPNKRRRPNHLSYASADADATPNPLIDEELRTPNLAEGDLSEDLEVTLDPEDLAKEQTGELDSLEAQLTDLKAGLQPEHFGDSGDERMESYTFEETEDKDVEKWTLYQSSRGHRERLLPEHTEGCSLFDLKAELKAEMTKRTSYLEATKLRLAQMKVQREQLSEKVRVAENQLSAKILGNCFSLP